MFRPWGNEEGHATWEKGRISQSKGRPEKRGSYGNGFRKTELPNLK